MNEIKPNFVPFQDEKERMLKLSRTKIISMIKKEKPKNIMMQKIKSELLNETKKNFFNNYKNALLFVLFYAIKFEELKKNKEKLKIEKLKTKIFWDNPSKDLLIFFLYTFLFEKYHEYLIVHMEYMSEKSIDVIIKEIKRF